MKFPPESRVPGSFETNMMSIFSNVLLFFVNCLASLHMLHSLSPQVVYRYTLFLNRIGGAGGGYISNFTIEANRPSLAKNVTLISLTVLY